MKWNFIISVICSLLLGYLCANFLFQSQNQSSTMFRSMTPIYFLKYSDSISKTKDHLPVHIVVKEDGKDCYYVGITTLDENAWKIQEEYKKQGIELLIVEKKVNSEEFVSELSQYDILLKSTKTKEEMNSVLSTVLSSYEEFVLNQ